MGLLASIVDYYANGVSTEATALRSALGTGKLYEGSRPESLTLPYVRVSEIGTAVYSEGKDLSYRVELVSVQFDVFAVTRASAEGILEALENVYIRQKLTVDNRIHLATSLTNRFNMEENPKSYRGTLQLEFTLEKSPQ